MPYRVLHIILSIVGGIMLFLGTILLMILSGESVEEKSKEEYYSPWLLTIGWWLYVFGLLTGMIWAYFAYDLPWVWDPKEVSMLLAIAYYSIFTSQWWIDRKKTDLVKIGSSFIGILLIAITFAIPFFLSSYHSHF